MRVEASMIVMMVRGKEDGKTKRERATNKDVKSDATWDQPPS
jgi:hypothetical protein